MSQNQEDPHLLPHHMKSSVSLSRAKYRDSRRERAVKVYTINLESFYLIIQNVPSLGIAEDLRALCEQYGTVEKFESLKDYPREDFTDVYLVKYQWFSAARTAKKYLDEKSFYGSLLHVCYGPEYESVTETKEKLGERRKYVASFKKTGNHNSKSEPNIQSNVEQCNKDPVADSSTDDNANLETAEQPITYIWAGKEYTVYPSQQKPNETPSSSYQPKPNESSSSFYQPKPYTPNTSLTSSEKRIKKRLSKLNVPNARVSFKRRKRI